MLFSTLKLFALAAVVSALPAKLDGLTPNLNSTADAPEISDARISVDLCTGAFPNNGCNRFTMSKGRCVNFTGGKGAYYKTLTGVGVPAGYICTLYKDFSCYDSPTDYVRLHAAEYNLEAVKVPDGLGLLIDFNDEASSIACE